MNRQTNQEKLLGTKIVTKATNAEAFYLWCLHAKDSPYKDTQRGAIPKADWEHESRGFYEQIGTLAGMPIVISGSWAVVNNKRVLFIEMTSQVCDYRMLDKWLEEHCPNAEETTDAMNFGVGIL